MITAFEFRGQLPLILQILLNFQPKSNMSDAFMCEDLSIYLQAGVTDRF